MSIPATIKVGNDVYSVVGIADEAFSNCSEVKKITIGSNVVSLGKDVFVGCNQLATIVWKATRCGDFKESPFLGLTSLTDVEFDKVKYIPANLLHNLELESVVLETTKNDSLVLGVNALKFNSAESVQWSVPMALDFTETPFGDVKKFSFWAKNNKSNPDAVVPAYLCAGLGIETITINNNISAINPNAFKGCANLKDIKWDARVCADFDVTPFGRKLGEIENIGEYIKTDNSLQSSLIKINDLIKFAKKVSYAWAQIIKSFVNKLP